MLRKIKLKASKRIKDISKDLSLCLLSAGLLTISFPKFDFWFLSWFGFVPLFFTIKEDSKAKTFFSFYIAGLIFWFGIGYWLVHVTLLGLMVVILYLALYFGIFGVILSITSRTRNIYSLFFIPSAWVILEYIRGYLFSGLPWALLGYSQYKNLSIIQIADITGVWGVSFLVMMVNVAIWEFIKGTEGKKAKLQIQSGKNYLLVSFLCLTCVFVYGKSRLNNQINSSNASLRVSVAQGNIPQDLKWDSDARDFIMNRYLSLTSQIAYDRPELIIWPEAAMPVVIDERDLAGALKVRRIAGSENESFYYDRLVGFVKAINTPLLLGAVLLRANNYYNSAMLISCDGRLSNIYDKLHLVPFGEYIPLKRIFGFLDTVVPIGDFSRGSGYTVFKLPVSCRLLPLKFSVLICFEDIFPDLSRKFTMNGADFLVNITNDAWFKKTTSPYQHLQASVFRAVENRRFLVRAANTGVSAFISPNGKIIALVEDNSGNNIFIEGHKTCDILMRNDISFYSRFGDVFVLACIFFVIYSIISYNLKRRNTRYG